MFAAWHLRRYWIGTGFTFTRRPPAWWCLGEVIWLGFLRSAPMIVGVVWIGVIEIVVAVVTAAATPDAKAGTPVVIAMSVLLLSAFAVTLSVILFSRPRFLIPPRFRTERGAVAEWRQRRAPRSRSKR